MRALAACLILALAGCGDDHAAVDAGHDQSVYAGDLAFEPSDAGQADFAGLDATGVCTFISNDAKAVASVAGEGALPTAGGGTLLDGVYYLVALERYAGSTMAPVTTRRTMRISGGATSFEDVIDLGSQSPELRERYAITNPGTEITLSSVMCDEPMVVVTFGYTASGRNLTLIDTGALVTYTFELE